MAGADEIVVRRARTPDVRGIRRLVDTYTDDRRLLSKATVTLYEQVQEFRVAVHPSDGTVVGCGALHVMWEDLAEVRTVAVDPECRGHKIGHRIVSDLLGSAREIGVRRVFVPGAGVPEDPATGSASCAVAGLLAHHSGQANGRFSYRIAQGVEMGRPSVLLARAEKADGSVQATAVGGACVFVSEGFIQVD